MSVLLQYNDADSLTVAQLLDGTKMDRVTSDD